MSRIGKLPISLPPGVSVSFEDNQLVVTGPKGVLTVAVHSLVTLEISESVLTLTRHDDQPASRAMHGLMRQLINNAVLGVSQGFEKRLDMKGVGYRAALEGERLVLSVGYSHPVKFDPPAGIKFAVEKNSMIITGIDKQQVGQIAAVIRKVRPPEPYKGKGIMYAGEIVRRKAGKAAKAGS
ncbi:MAG: large subunit ribosomal protein L6 [Candidatus Berkelbacteria bacterium Gr01-1014_85]|uniref:Large ribosomal subunit protein uL6 n=1 Tax=Candidatus Berkelbacteria bacterium Gr01-1014_85 TaxID=2017150 RepID=A0A554JCY0_9BACT|nr:MAG: large subunit ribosomal protein L6 [Candidatus Berkelbacteria bacterium Gr01-1014_85]